MKHLLKSALAVLLMAIGFTSCEEIKPLSMEEVGRYQDEIGKIIPGARSVQVKEVRNFNTEVISVNVIVASPVFYTATPEQLAEAAVKAGQLALTTFTSKVEAGTLIITKEVKVYNNDEGPSDGINADMKLDSLRAVMEKK